MEKSTREPQYQFMLELREKKGLTQLGLVTNQTWDDDPRRLLFYLARYKFVSKMLSGKKRVLEIGCGDAFGSRIIRQEVENLCVVDFDEIFINDVTCRMEKKWQSECRLHDILSSPVSGPSFDAAYSLDVIEHIPKEKEDIMLMNIVSSLDEYGVLIIGTPSIQSQLYASPASKEGHINCKDGMELKSLMLKYFHNVFLFSMNDEVVHTGFYPMAHYLLVLCVGKRSHNKE